jgi:hypothetical protein
MSVRSTMNPRHLGIGVMVASAALGVSFAGATPAYPATKSAATPASQSSQWSSAPSAAVVANTLVITGTNGADQIAVAGSNDDPNALDVDLGNGTRLRFDRTTFAAISVQLRDGDDEFTEPGGVFADEALTVDAGSGDDKIVTGDGNDLILGGHGDDVIFGGKGDDTIFGGSGDDFADGQVGHDTAFLGSGHDTFQWDAGDGSDVVDGGHSTDTLVFNGAAASETMSLSAVGDRSVFLRDPGNIRMDMNSVERLQLNALAGADTVTVNDMSGTGFRDADIDLGAADGATDVVTVNGTENRDQVRVDAHGSQVNVEGLQTDTHITGSEKGNDNLQVNTLGGNDRVRVDDDASALIGVHTDLGSGE